MEIEIEAPPARIWEALTDFASYAQWNPFMTRASGRARVAERLAITYSFPDGAEDRIRPEIITAHPPSELRWRSHVWLQSLLNVEHYFLLRELASGSTRVAHGEHLSGALLKYMGRRHTEVGRGMVAMNLALKQRVEG